MNLSQIRAQFKKLSGRYDLVTPAGADSGADYFIRGGQNYLDGLAVVPKATGRVFKIIKAGDYYCTFTRTRSIKNVWVGDHDSRWKLEKQLFEELRTNYPQPFTSMTGGEPLYFTPALLRGIPDEPTIGSPYDLYIEYSDLPVGSNFSYNGILFMPPADGEYQLEVEGLFYSNELLVDDDQSFWSVNYPNILVMASLRELEAHFRNTEGMKDWTNAIDLAVFNINKDFVEEVSHEVNQMEG